VKLTKLDDQQAWLVSEGDVHLVIDPAFGRARPHAPDAPSGFLLSAHVDERLSKDARGALETHVPVHAAAGARARLRSLGFRDVQAHSPGSRFEVAGTFDITTVVSAFPYHASTLGFLVESRASGLRVYFEPRLTDEARLGALPPGLDAIVCPCEPAFAFLVQLAMDTERTARTIARLRPKRFVQASTAPARGPGWLGRFARRTPGSASDLARILGERRVGTQVITPRVGEPIAL
jgi:hypothetical protein